MITYLGLRHILFILTIQVFPILTFGQGTDSVFTTALLEKYVNRCIDNLETVEYLNNSGLPEELAFCNLATCFSVLEAYDKDTLLNQAIYERLRQIAQVFHNEGTPILILGSGSNSIESSERLNSVKNPYGITYVSIGNSCLTFGSKNKGIFEFNRETKRLVNYQVPSDKKLKKRRKEKRVSKHKIH